LEDRKSQNSDEKIFIAWGGNQALAELVHEKLKKYNYDGIVGGGAVTDMFLGSQIFAQIRQSTQSIILVQQQDSSDGTMNFNDNMMFEWGYLTARMQPGKIHVFLIDLLTRNLPSDLMGTWATPIMQAGRELDEIAEDIARIFYANASRPVELDKMRIIHTWDQTKNLLKSYNEEPSRPDIEMAHILLHSIEVCSYYIEEEFMEETLNKINPISSLLTQVINICKTQNAIMRETSNLGRHISFDAYLELGALCEINFDTNRDENLDLWVKFHLVDQVTMLDMSIAKNPELATAEKNNYHEKVINGCTKALAILENIITVYPKEKNYAGLYFGYKHPEFCTLFY